ncbi:hypothetical protein [Nonomuraea sp. NPDC049309]|uniref:hypothetical protein n=1 Tax=Nonomuraea sp. NPDC049309 TaxID=3364350 RepID=UPI00371BA885
MRSGTFSAGTARRRPGRRVISSRSPILDGDLGDARLQGPHAPRGELAGQQPAQAGVRVRASSKPVTSHA